MSPKNPKTGLISTISTEDTVRILAFISVFVAIAIAAFSSGFLVNKPTGMMVVEISPIPFDQETQYIRRSQPPEYEEEVGFCTHYWNVYVYCSEDGETIKYDRSYSVCCSSGILMPEYSSMDSIKNTIKSGILPKTYWLIGLPFESESDIESTKNLIQKTISLGALPKWVTPLCLFPGLELFENANKYGIKLKLNKFQDFFSYSSTIRNQNSWYPQVITHETEYFTINEILKKSLEIKRFISARKDIILNYQKENLKNYFKFHPKFNENILFQRIKLVPDLLKYTFF